MSNVERKKSVGCQTIDQERATTSIQRPEEHSSSCFVLFRDDEDFKDTKRANKDTKLARKRIVLARNLVLRLREREIHNAGNGTTHFNRKRKFYENVLPNFTIPSVEKPPCFLRKFTPDGRNFIAFSAYMNAVEVYEYLGVQQCGNLLQKLPPNFEFAANNEQISAQQNEAFFEVRRNVFKTLFKLKHSISLNMHGSEQLNRECSVFTDDSRFAIVASASHIPDELYPSLYEQMRTNESISTSTSLEDYAIHCVDLTQGRHCDTVRFKCDKIYLSHNQGIYLCGRTFIVLSVQHQTVHVFRLSETGQFISLVQIGRFVFPDDEDFIQACARSETESQVPRPPSFENVHASQEPFYGSLKQRILSFLYRSALERSRSEGDSWALMNFYRTFDYFLEFRIWRTQLLSEEHLLLRMAPEDVVTLKTSSDAQTSLFVFYNIQTASVEAVYENRSEEMLKLYEQFADWFRHPQQTTDENAAKISTTSAESPCSSAFFTAPKIIPNSLTVLKSGSCSSQTSLFPITFPCSVSCSIHARMNHEKSMETISSAKFGGHVEAVKRCLAQLPISAQSFSLSPYLDLSLFSYDEKWIAMLERPKTCGDSPVRFYSRETGALAFQLFCASPVPPTANGFSRNLVAFVFHPTDPLAISVQRCNRDYIVNVHLRHSP